MYDKKILNEVFQACRKIIEENSDADPRALTSSLVACAVGLTMKASLPGYMEAALDELDRVWQNALARAMDPATQRLVNRPGQQFN